MPGVKVTGDFSSIVDALEALANPASPGAVLDEYQRLAQEGYGFIANGGAGSTVITFAGAYDADAPDFHLHVPSGKTVIPLRIEVIFEAVGTESTMEIIALASNTGDPTATGTGVPMRNLNLASSIVSGCTATAAIDAAGITDPNAGRFFEFWKYQLPLTDTVATGENDRNPLVFTWSAFTDGPPPRIVGSVGGSCLAVYAASQAGTGFITVSFLEIDTP